MTIAYRDIEQCDTAHTIWSLVLIYYFDTAMIVAWCELCEDLCHFRLNKVEISNVLPENFEGFS